MKTRFGWEGRGMVRNDFVLVYLFVWHLDAERSAAAVTVAVPVGEPVTVADQQDGDDDSQASVDNEQRQLINQ